jgi:hypothetical protein
MKTLTAQSRGHGVCDGIEARQAERPQHDRRQAGQEDVNDRDAAGDLRGARQHLVGVEGFDAKQLHAADLQDRQNGHRHDDDADAAEPLQDGPPQQNTRRRLVKADDHRGAGGRHARHGFEEGIRDAEVEARKRQGQRAEGGGHQPCQVGHDEGLAQVEALPAGPGGQDHGHADEEGDGRRRREDLPVGMAGGEIDRRRNHHGDGENRDQDADDEDDRSEIDHGGSNDGGCGTGLQTWWPPAVPEGLPISARNSRRVRASLRNSPSIRLVTMATPGRWTPRVVMH